MGILITQGTSLPAVAKGDDRTLSFYNPRNKEELTITYKRDGKVLPEAAAKIDWFMRDWREDRAIKMDRKLFDILWELYRDVGSQQAIHLVSGYRSPKTNRMLRRRSRAVARRSRHMIGSAADIYLPDVSTKRLRELALVKREGGVGYYPHSGKYGFIHVDTGSVRHWPRMNPVALARLFKKKDSLIARRRAPGTPIQLARASLSAGKRATAVSTPATIGAAPTPRSRPVIVASLGGTPKSGESIASLIERSKITTASTAKKSAPLPRQKPYAIAALRALTPPSPSRSQFKTIPAAAAGAELNTTARTFRFIDPVSAGRGKSDRLDAGGVKVAARLVSYSAPKRRLIINRAPKGNLLMTHQVRPGSGSRRKADGTASLIITPAGARKIAFNKN